MGKFCKKWSIYIQVKIVACHDDFSGIIFDYTFLCDKPVIYVADNIDLRPYDAYDLGKELWQFETLKKMGIKLDENNFDNISEVIKNASDSKELSEQRKIAKETAWMHIGNAGKNIADFMINKEKTFVEEK